MIVAEGTRRANFRTVKDSLASDTSSKKQTQIVSALPASISVSAPERGVESFALEHIRDN
jgi:hypothetical protein